MGSGIQSAVVISLLPAYREISKENAVLLFEEPELFLHPHGRRHLFGLLCELEEAGTQVIYTTHSQDVIDLEHLDSVHLVTSNKTDGTVASPPDAAALPTDWKERMRIAKHFGSPRDEVFFADTVVLVEGVTEKAAIRLLAEMYPKGMQLDRLNCSVIEAGGKGSLPLMTGVVSALGKPVLVVYDTDFHLNGTNSAEHNDNLNNLIDTACRRAGAMVHAFDPYLEEEIGIEGASKKNKDGKMREYLAGLGSWDTIPEPLKNLMELVARRSGKVE